MNLFADMLIIFILADETKKLFDVILIYSSGLVVGMVNIRELFYRILLYLLLELLLKG